MNKHTPGPWTLEKQEKNRFDQNTGEQLPSHIDYRISKDELFVSMTIPDCNANAEADARLIAAAPELLECVQALIKACYGSLSDKEASEIRDKAHAAIAKATGGEG